MREAGAEVSVEYAAAGRPNIVGLVRGAGRGRSLLLNAHLDTVGAGSMQNPFTPRIEHGRLYGRGAYDMKGGLAAAMLAIRQLAAQPAAGDVLLTAVSDEEYASIGTAAVLKNWRAEAAVVTEPTALNICVAHKGFVWFDVASLGCAAHGSKPEIGVDAIANMGGVLARMRALDERLRTGRRHPLLGTGSIHASLISGGRELSTYPDYCRLSAERRTVPGETRAQVEAEIAGLARDASASAARSDIRASISLVRDAFEVDPREPIVQVLREHAAIVTGRLPEIYGETPWFDSALISGAGIPTVVFGPGGGGAHADVEWSTLDEVRQCAAILASTARSFCSGATGSTR
jgi:acetylornithine deacetylase